MILSQNDGRPVKSLNNTGVISMNSELYFPRNGKSFAKTSEMDFEDTVKLLGDVDINIIYKTEINLTQESFTDALEESSAGDEKIHLIVVADAFRKHDQEKAIEGFRELGVEGKIKKIEAPVLDLDSLIDEKHRNDKITPVMPTLKVDESESDNNVVILGQPKRSEPEKQENDGKKEEKLITAYTTVYNQILVVFLPEEKTAGEDFNTILYSVCKSLLKPKSKPKLWTRFIPCKGDAPFDVIRKVVLMLAICTFIVSSVMLVNLLVIRPAVNDSQNEQIRNMLVVNEPEIDPATGKTITKKPIDGSQGTLVDFSKLVKENDDTIGWIKVPNTKIDYVVCQPPEGEDHEYYLYKDFYKNYDTYGTVFLDYRSKLDSQNLILHGHNMRDGRMFGTLKYFEDLSFYKKNPVFTFNTIYEKSQWKIISIMKTNTLESQGEFFNYLRGDFENDYDFLNFIYQIRERSIIDTPVTANENDTLVTLSTCTYDFSQFRFVVVARKVRDGEDASVNSSSAKENPDTLYPDIWYSTYGGQKPDVTTFQEAFNKNKITWYDGKRTDWSEKDDEKLFEELKEGKENAIKELENFIKQNHYEEAEQKQVDKLLEDYKKMINNARSRTEINEIFNTAVDDIRKIKTIEAKNAEIEESSRQAVEAELNEKRVAAKEAIQNSVDGKNYRTTQRLIVESAIEDYFESIDNAQSIEEIDKIKEDAIKALAKVKTDEEIKKEESSELEASKKREQSIKDQMSKDEASRKAEESRKAQESSEAAAKALSEAKSKAVSNIKNGVSLGNYKYAQQQEIVTLQNRYISLVNGAKSTDDVNAYAAEFQNRLRGIKTAAQIDAENSQQSQASIVEPSPVEPPPVESSEPEPTSEPESSVPEESETTSVEPE